MNEWTQLVIRLAVTLAMVAVFGVWLGFSWWQLMAAAAVVMSPLELLLSRRSASVHEHRR